MDLPRLQFRNTLSQFFRIYGKNNSNKQRPLQVHGGSESQKDAIHILVKLFDMYSSVLEFERQLKLAEDKIKAFRDAGRFQFIPSAVDSMKKYEENVVAIGGLENKRDDLCHMGSQPINAEDLRATNERNELKRILQDLRRSIRAKEDELHLLKTNIQQGGYPTDADLMSLQEFFPNANLVKIMELESFHSKIQVILEQELDSAVTKVEEALLPLRKRNC